MSEPSLLSPSKTKILFRLIPNPATAGEIATTLNIQVSAARKHLEDLQKLGIVSEEFRRAGVGRPKKFYQLTDRGRELFPRHYDTILNAVIDKLVQVQGPDYAESVMNNVARDMVNNINPDGGSQTETTQRVLAGLDKLGFQPDLKEHDSRYIITSSNCPLLKTALAHKELVCRGLHEQILKSALGAAKVERENWIVSGDSYCKHIITKSAKGSRHGLQRGSSK